MMNFPVEAHCDDKHLHVTLADGRSLSAPLAWYSRLASASALERDGMELTANGVHWPELDLVITVDAILRLERDPEARAS